MYEKCERKQRPTIVLPLYNKIQRFFGAFVFVFVFVFCDMWKRAVVYQSSYGLNVKALECIEWITSQMLMRVDENKCAKCFLSFGRWNCAKQWEINCSVMPFSPWKYFYFPLLVVHFLVLVDALSPAAHFDAVVVFIGAAVCSFFLIFFSLRHHSNKSTCLTAENQKLWSNWKCAIANNTHLMLPNGSVLEQFHIYIYTYARTTKTKT